MEPAVGFFSTPSRFDLGGRGRTKLAGPKRPLLPPTGGASTTQGSAWLSALLLSGGSGSELGAASIAVGAHAHHQRAERDQHHHREVPRINSVGDDRTVGGNHGDDQ